MKLSILTGSSLRLCKSFLAAARAELDDLPEAEQAELADQLWVPRILTIEAGIDHVLSEAEVAPR